MKRSFVNARKDKKIFSKTARRVRRVNLPVTNSRGGIRL